MRRKRTTTQKKAFSVIIDKSLADDVERLSEKLQQSRNQTVINLIGIGLSFADKLTANGLEFLVAAEGDEASAIRWAYLSGQLDLDAIINKDKKDIKSKK